MAKAILGFKARQSQLDMAHAVASVIKDKKQLVVEAGTGTGKTFAYLAPALLAGKKSLFLPELRHSKSSCFTVIYH
ncbi:hypothetical protein PN838_06635 [Psychrosphaera sp. G1-22]|uniref:Helicase ATP-binding domain-containing protein n=1 Tax=Psychrosphaera algicola TaxID=3023714 RepID=A0ABT5FD27_9GAMM|nr:hypothetical protein [Psychrosphaera sp. G1-22]MDC2888486.1 hypothetical protein [Psychrosphaera sp. G1-22]